MPKLLNFLSGNWVFLKYLNIFHTLKFDQKLQRVAPGNREHITYYSILDFSQILKGKHIAVIIIILLKKKQSNMIRTH
jgi:hypothetical protein